MTLALHPVTADVARGVLDGAGLDEALAAVSLTRVRDWPHDDTPDALRPLAEHPELAGPGTFLVVDGATVVGDCGWFGPADDEGTAEIGYGLAASARGRGWGTQAVRLLLEWVTAQPHVRLVRASVLPGNTPSLALLHRLGFVQTGLSGDHLELTLAT